jgi:hypothetical protein
VKAGVAAPSDNFNKKALPFSAAITGLLACVSGGCL